LKVGTITLISGAGRAAECGGSVLTLAVLAAAAAGVTTFMLPRSWPQITPWPQQFQCAVILRFWP
jgi:hypothetical protein